MTRHPSAVIPWAENVLGEVETDCGDMRNLHGGRRSSLWRLATTTLWHAMPGVGAAHPIRSRSAVVHSCLLHEGMHYGPGSVVFVWIWSAPRLTGQAAGWVKH